MQFRVQLGTRAVDSPAWLRGWPGRILAALLTIVTLAGLFLFFTLFLAIGAVALLVFGVRFWWRMRKMSRPSGRSPGPNVIDAEHTVIDVDVIEAPRREG